MRAAINPPAGRGFARGPAFPETPMNKGEFEMLLFAIARIHLNIDTLETRYSDRLDFHDCAVWCIRAALTAAYDAGVIEGRRNASK